MTLPDSSTNDLHEWLSFDVDDVTYQFDVTFLTSPWTCIFGRGCPGVLTGDAAELEQGCCSYGAHFTDKADRRRVTKLAATLGPDEWQFRKESDKAGGPVYKNEDSEWVSRMVDDACIFLNRPGFATGPGCALHQAAVNRGERFIDWKPDVCWQLPLRLEEKIDQNDHTTNVLREWKRRDWGEGGVEFHWWCTSEDDAFIGHRPVYEELRDEMIELVGEGPYETFVDQVGQRPSVQFLPHPALKTRR
ncbi:MAG: hypothetical protein WCK41_04945 [Actinomycetes bacterium]